MDDELAAFESELKALESTSEPKPAPQLPRAPQVISSAPVRTSQAVALSAPASGMRVPPSQWATPAEIQSQMRAEGLIVPAPQSTLAPGGYEPRPEAFLMAPSFQGPKPGYVFKSGVRGVGYYLEGAVVESGSAAFARAAAPAASSSSQQAPFSAVAAVPSSAIASASASSKAPGQPQPERNITRTIAGVTWEDRTMLEWPEDDFRCFIGDLGNEVNDDVLAHAFQKYPSFQKARVVKDPKSHKTRGYGFVSFRDPWDYTKALREMQGKYVGNRPIKIRKASTDDRSVTADHQPLQFNHALSVSDKSTARHFKRGHASHTEPTWVKKKKKGMPW